MVDWPERIYVEPERNWIITLDGKDYLTGAIDLSLLEHSTTSPLRFALKTEDIDVQFQLEFVGEEESADFTFTLLGSSTATIRHGEGARDQRQLSSFFNDDPPTIWFADGSALEGNRFVELKVPPPSFEASAIEVWDWSQINITKESQGKTKNQNSVQGKLIQELLRNEEYVLVFDDDSPGEIADVVAIRVPGGLDLPERIEVELYHCKFSGGSKAGARVGDLYEVCGQAQKSIWWSASLLKKADIFTHLMRREEQRASQATRIERGSTQTLATLREIAKQLPMTMKIGIVQPGISKKGVSEDQLRILGVTQEFLRSHFEIPFTVLGSA